MRLLSSAAAVMLLAQGFLAGGALVLAVDRLNVWDEMGIKDYAVDFRRTVLHVDPMLPIFAVLASVAAVVFAFQTTGVVSVLAWVASSLNAGMILASAVYAERINSRFRRLPEGQVPTGADRFRSAWRRFHLARTATFVCSFSLLVTAVVT